MSDNSKEGALHIMSPADLAEAYGWAPGECQAFWDDMVGRLGPVEIHRVMTDEERDAQRRSFAVGLMSFESPLSVEEKRKIVDATVDAERRNACSAEDVAGPRSAASKAGR
jgi:hypothetical protein